MTVLTLAASFCGGMFGAALGAVPSFIITGILGLIGIGVQAAGAAPDWHSLITYGPLFGPQVTFAAGCVATAYARRIGAIPSGKAVGTALLGCNKSSILLVGGIVGIIGYPLQQWIASLASHGETDSIALTIVILTLAGKVIFGKHGIKEVFGVLSDDAKKRGRFRMGGDNRWIPYQEKMSQKVMIAIAAGGVSSIIAVQMLEIPDMASNAMNFGFCLSAASLIFAQDNNGGSPFTHHITLVASVAAVASGNFLWGIAFGIIASQLRDIGARLFYIHGDAHVDPPSFAIFTGTTLSFLFGTAGIYNIGGYVIPAVIIAAFLVWSVADHITYNRKQLN